MPAMMIIPPKTRAMTMPAMMIIPQKLTPWLCQPWWLSHQNSCHDYASLDYYPTKNSCHDYASLYVPPKLTPWLQDPETYQQPLLDFLYRVWGSQPAPRVLPTAWLGGGARSRPWGTPVVLPCFTRAPCRPRLKIPATTREEVEE
jgi:hypothetical protein